jgi:hypothetical protein
MGKCEANRFLMNRATATPESGCPEAAEIDKAFVIQNLFQRLMKLVFPPEIFLNYSLDTKLSPARGVGLAELVDNHPQHFENKAEFLLCPQRSQDRRSPAC